MKITWDRRTIHDINNNTFDIWTLEKETFLGKVQLAVFESEKDFLGCAKNLDCNIEDYFEKYLSKN